MGFVPVIAAAASMDDCRPARWTDSFGFVSKMVQPDIITIESRHFNDKLGLAGILEAKFLTAFHHRNPGR